MAKRLDLTGQRFGRLTVLEEAEPRRHPNGKTERRWRCRCDCGTVCEVAQGQLRSGGTRSCGCVRRETSAAKARDLTGQRFGRLTVLRRERLENPSSDGEVNGWLCRCDCGTEKVIRTQVLLRGEAVSCGCEAVRKLLQRTAADGENVLGRYDGTVVSTIRPGRKRNGQNKTGVTGVCWAASKQRWAARLGLRGKSIHLGYFKRFEDAVAARKAAEAKHYAPILEAYDAEQAEKETTPGEN